MDSNREREEPFGFDGRSLEEQLASLDAYTTGYNNPRPGTEPEHPGASHQDAGAAEGQPGYEPGAYVPPAPPAPGTPAPPDWQQRHDFPSPQREQPAPDMGGRAQQSSDAAGWPQQEPPGTDAWAQQPSDAGGWPQQPPESGQEPPSGTTMLRSLPYENGAQGPWPADPQPWSPQQAPWGAGGYGPPPGDDHPWSYEPPQQPAYEDFPPPAGYGEPHPGPYSEPGPYGEPQPGPYGHPQRDTYGGPPPEVYGEREPSWSPGYPQPWPGDSYWGKPVGGGRMWPADAPPGQVPPPPHQPASGQYGAPPHPGAPPQPGVAPPGVPPPQPGFPPHEAPPHAGPGEPQSAESLSPESLLRGRRRAPSSGWRRALYRVSGGAIDPGESPAEVRRLQLAARARTFVGGGHHRVAILSLKGGVGKTTTTVGLGSTLASLRGDRVVAIDANPDRGTLSDKVRLETAATVRDLLNERESVLRYADARGFTSQAASRLEVLASDRDPAVSEAFSADDYNAVAQLLEHFYSICLTDCGTGLLHSAMSGVLSLADQIVLVSSPSVDGARSASATLDWLEAHECGDLVRGATVALSSVREDSKSTVDLGRLEQHFASRCNAVVRIPYDPHLEEGAEIELDRLKPATRDAYLVLAATVGDGLHYRRTGPGH